ncbi:MAG: hypothetical protein JSR60_01805 [Proteobacteria bacterium]|nr:hypothetical protein [Pseudomonadota bacterium]
MTGMLRRALCAVAGTLAFASVVHAAAPTASPLQAAASMSDADSIDFSAARLMDVISSGPPPTRRLPVASSVSGIAQLGGMTVSMGNRIDLAGDVTPIEASDTHDAGLFSAASASSGYDVLTAGGSAFNISSALDSGLNVNVSFASLAPGISNYAMTTGDALWRMSGDAVPYVRRGAQSFSAGLSWDINDWAELGFAGTQTVESNGLLGNPAPGINATTASLGVSAKLRLGNGWVTTASYSEGVTQLDLRPGGRIGALPFDSMHSRTYGIAIAKNGLFGDDALGLAVSRPALGGIGGEFVTLSGPSGWPAAFAARGQRLENTAPETDVEIGYVTTFMDGAVALQTNAAFQMNYAGQYGSNAVSLLSRARIKF